MKVKNKSEIITRNPICSLASPANGAINTLKNPNFFISKEIVFLLRPPPHLEDLVLKKHLRNKIYKELKIIK